MKKEFFISERTQYYRDKKNRLSREKEESRVVKEDALFVRHYGMTAYLQLFPEASGFGINWHKLLLKELVKMENEHLATVLSGIQLAYASTHDKESAKYFKALLKDLEKN